MSWLAWRRKWREPILEGIRKRLATRFHRDSFIEELERSRRANIRQTFRLARLKAEGDLLGQKVGLELLRIQCRRAGIDPETAVMSDEALDTAHAAHMEELNRWERAFIGEPEILT